MTRNKELIWDTCEPYFMPVLNISGAEHLGLQSPNSTVGLHVVALAIHRLTSLGEILNIFIWQIVIFCKGT